MRDAVAFKEREC